MDRGTIEFVEAKAPIRKPTTKFGGQPVWLAGPQWPISRSTAEPMRFIGQVVIPNRILPLAVGTMAYVFMTDSEVEVPETWSPLGGENAVVLQSAEGRRDHHCEMRPVVDGPTLIRYEQARFSRRRRAREVEYEATLKWGSDPTFVSMADWMELSDEAGAAYEEAVRGNKVGGTPGFLQSDEFPDEAREWHLLLQLDATTIPFFLNLGDAGVAYVFIDEAAEVGRMLWQCM